MAEFTGERVIPGEVSSDLLNEHVSRYAFAGRLARGKKVLDVGCGLGYGAAEMANYAHHVTGLDVAPDAVLAASEAYPSENLLFLAGSATNLPFPDSSFDLITAFEVIEHLSDWKLLLEEGARVLSPGGQFMVSTPNRLYYAEHRAESGPNPFHVHEFEFGEFQLELERVFPSVRLFLQNHANGIVFQPVPPNGNQPAELSVCRQAARPEESHFFVAVCAKVQQTGSPTYVYLPSSGNVLREREQHIRLLESELKDKNAWLKQSLQKHADLVQLHETQAQWCMELDKQLNKARERIVELQGEVEQEQKAALEAIDRYETELKSLRSHHTVLNEEVQSRAAELARCVELLDRAETTVVERTQWAKSLQQKMEALETVLRSVESSRWIRLGNRFGLGPKLGGQ